MPTVQLKSIICILNDEIDKDEVYLKMNGKKIWPKGAAYKSMDSGEKVDMSLQFDVPEGEINIELWDFDLLSKNDLLGTFKLQVDDRKGNYAANMILKDPTSTANYVLDWAIA